MRFIFGIVEKVGHSRKLLQFACEFISQTRPDDLARRLKYCISKYDSSSLFSIQGSKARMLPLSKGK